LLEARLQEGELEVDVLVLVAGVEHECVP
jgi:hypothetical protein